MGFAAQLMQPLGRLGADSSELPGAAVHCAARWRYTHDKSRGCHHWSERHAAHNYSPLPVVAASAEVRGSPISTALTPLDRSAAALSQPLALHWASTATAHARSRHWSPAESGLACRPTKLLGAGQFSCGKDVVLPMNSDTEAWWRANLGRGEPTSTASRGRY